MRAARWLGVDPEWVESHSVVYRQRALVAEAIEADEAEQARKREARKAARGRRRGMH